MQGRLTRNRRLIVMPVLSVIQGRLPKNRSLIVVPVFFGYTREIVEESELNAYTHRLYREDCRRETGS